MLRYTVLNDNICVLGVKNGEMVKVIGICMLCSILIVFCLSFALQIPCDRENVISSSLYRVGPCDSHGGLSLD